MKRTNTYLVLAPLLMLWLVSWAPTARAVDFTIIEPPPGVLGIAPSGINARGQIVGEYTDALTGRRRGFLLDHGVFTTIHVSGAKDTAARGINDRGQIVGNYWVEANFGLERHGFLLEQGVLSTMDVPGATSILLNGINDRGQIVATTSIGTSILDHGKVTTLPGVADASGINARGQVVGATGGLEGSGVWYNGTFNPITISGSVFTRAIGINNAGQVVGFYNSDIRHGFLFNRGAVTNIDVPGAIGTEATAISSSGQIVGFFFDAVTIRGFIAIP